MATHALVWFMRDLRVRDHAPLAAAQDFDSAAGLFIIEPAWLHSAECDASHVAFALDCVAELRRKLAARGLPLAVRVGEARTVLAELRSGFGFTHLLSHEETGSGWSYARDRAVSAWCGQHGVEWRQYPQTGVVRALRNRDGWARRWHCHFMQKLETPPQMEFRNRRPQRADAGRFASGRSAAPAAPRHPAAAGAQAVRRGTPRVRQLHPMVASHRAAQPRLLSPGCSAPAAQPRLLSPG